MKQEECVRGHRFESWWEHIFFHSIFCTENCFDENSKSGKIFLKIFEKNKFQKYFRLNKNAANNGIKKLIKVVLLVGIYCSIGR